MIIISAVRVLLKGSLVWFIWKNTNLKKRLVPLKYVREYLQYCRNWPFTSFCVRTMKVLALKENSLFPWTGQSNRSLSMSPKYWRLFFLSYIHTCIWKPKGAHTRRASTHTHTIILFQASVSHAWVFTWPRGRQHICLARWLMPPASQAGRALADSTFVAPTIQKHHSNSGLRSQGS